ncbi:GTP pyrophosphokinase family protein [Aquibacillus koreensis]|uniref:GTP pyrophosphokinase family protein n=1 Tax=Aquibacillus koreensis TaxID=279446 RepID=A0A9X3WMN7_9BACI|nr:GTP pyrophosphokinase family protein [Aquibacillus koreensis]MCT2537288.1 GTP pyrophosphokinase family protein [Aquibacillus koreensis]MDC3421635.1 GTP pyrophosphokinase family protein [Aquibacillus koreensis]
MDVFQDKFNHWKNGLLMYKFALDEINTKLNILNEEFQFIHNHNPIEHIKSRIKDPSSIMNKLNRKGLSVTLENARSYVLDIAGVRVTCSFVRDIYKIHEMIASQDDINVIQTKDYIKNPKENGYRSLHMILEVPVFLANRTEYVPVEIQIRTIAMDTWASLEHKIFYKFDQDIPEKLKKELKLAADTVTALDDKMEYINTEVDKIKYTSKVSNV